MTNKVALIGQVLLNLRKAQQEKWVPPVSGVIKELSFPPVLWAGENLTIAVNESLLSAVSAYSRICWENDNLLKRRFKIIEFESIVKQSFGLVLVEIDLDLDDEYLVPIVADRVAERVHRATELQNRPATLTIGCHLIEGNEGFPIEIGPVVFETRESWRQRMFAAGKLSRTTAQRLEAGWLGNRLRKRKSSSDSSSEDAIRRAIGDCPVVCSVATNGLSSNYIQTKGLHAARLAMTSLALTWQFPSEGLRYMNLLYDRKLPRRYTTQFGDGKSVGYNYELSQLPHGRHSDVELIKSIQDYRWLFDTIGESLSGYVRPNVPSRRPTVMSALFLSLWWYHEACREPMDQIATTKFVASMDALADGRKATGIKSLIHARLGHRPQDVLMTDGRTTNQVIDRIYGNGRSKLLHGSSRDFEYDWTNERKSAEVIGRLLLVLCCEWIYKNENCDHLVEMIRN